MEEKKEKKKKKKKMAKNGELWRLFESKKTLEMVFRSP